MKSDGVDLHYVDTGPVYGSTNESGPVLVLIHGIGASYEDFEFQIPVFAATYRVIAPDLRGYGKSPKVGDYRVPTFAADVWRVLDDLGIRKFCLLGHSMGGAVALQMAVDQPERIERLIIADSLPSFIADTPGKRLMYWYRLAMMYVFGPSRLSYAVMSKLLPLPRQQGLRRRVAHRNARQNDREVYLRTIQHLIGWNVLDRLHRLVMPTLILFAEYDYFPRMDAVRFAESLPNARLIELAGAHHALPLEVPKLFNQAVGEFLSEDEGRTG